MMNGMMNTMMLCMVASMLFAPMITVAVITQVVL